MPFVSTGKRASKAKHIAIEWWDHGTFISTTIQIDAVWMAEEDESPVWDFRETISRLEDLEGHGKWLRDLVDEHTPDWARPRPSFMKQP